MPVVYRPYLEKLGGEANSTTFVGNSGELFYDPDSTELRISDGVTEGGLAITSRLLNYTSQTANLENSSATVINLTKDVVYLDSFDGGSQNQWFTLPNGRNGQIIKLIAGNGENIHWIKIDCNFIYHNGSGEANYGDDGTWLPFASGTDPNPVTAHQGIIVTGFFSNGYWSFDQGVSNY